MLPGGEISAGAAIVAAGEGKKPVGSVSVMQGERGLALLRLKPALAALEGTGSLHLEDGGQIVQPQRPCWWPTEWGHEEDGEQPQ